MNLRLYDNELNTLIYEKEYPHYFCPESNVIQENVVQLKDYIGNGYFREIFFDGVHIAFGDARLSEKLLLGFETDYESIEMHFALKGKNTAFSDTFEKEISFEAHNHNLIYANGMNGKMEWENEHFQVFEINLAPSFFKRFLPQKHQLFDAFRTAIEKGNSGLLHQKHRPISHKMYAMIDEMISCERTGIFKRMFLEAKVIELLLLQLEQFANDTFSHSTLKKSDVDKIYAVREFILQNLDTACSLIDLAHFVGTNDFILKKGFKELFGTTVFGFWNDAKMEQAKLLLTEQDMNVGEVSLQIGYKNQRHFSTAFKRKYGVLPSQLKK